MRAGRVDKQGDCAPVLAHPSRDNTRELLAAVPRLANHRVGRTGAPIHRCRVVRRQHPAPVAH